MMILVRGQYELYLTKPVACTTISRYKCDQQGGAHGVGSIVSVRALKRTEEEVYVQEAYGTVGWLRAG